MIGTIEQKLHSTGNRTKPADYQPLMIYVWDNDTTHCFAQTGENLQQNHCKQYSHQPQ